MSAELDNPWSQDLSDYDEQTQATIQQIITDDEQVRAQYFAKDATEQPAQVIGAVGFSGGLNMAIAPAVGPI